MTGLTAEYHLTIPAIMRRAESLSADAEIVSRSADGGVYRYRYCDMVRRAKQLAVALQGLGVRAGDRVGTLAWNHCQHVEAYFAISALGGVLHTLNLRLHPSDLAYIVEHAGDRAIIIDRSLLPIFAQMARPSTLEHVIVSGESGETPEWAIDYESLLRDVDAEQFHYIDVDERDAASMCYTSGTTGKPKGVVYSHRSIVLQALNWTVADTVGVSRRDTLLSVVPMFHINGWCLPFAATLVGAKLVLPGPSLDPASLLELIASEGVTLSAGVPTVWLGVLQALDRRVSTADISTLRTLVIGGSAVPKALVRAYDERYGVTVLQAWGMTETTALATVSSLPPDLEDVSSDAQYEWRAKQGMPMPFVEVRARGDAGLIPWDGQTMGELEVRGPAVASRYYNDATAADRFTEDHWFRTGDVVTITPRGCIELRDRLKDMIRSGGEWISSVALENALMDHPAVAEAAVVAVPHPKWDERPLAVVVLNPGHTVSTTDLQGHLEPYFAKWWVPDTFEFVDHIPRTSTGKFLKSALRERFSHNHSAAV